MNIPKLIWGNLTYIRSNEAGVKGLMDIVYAVFNAQSGGKLPPLSEDSKDLLYKFTQGDYFAELLENWSRDYDSARQQPKPSSNFTNDIHSKILSGLNKEGSGKV